MSATPNPNPTPNAEEDKKPNDIARINLKVIYLQDGNEVFFRIKRNTQLKKLMNAYCDRQSVDLNSIAFLFDGRRLRAEQTPAELEMEDGDEIDALLHQTGSVKANCQSFATLFE
ncbi:small ubiquitin-related modifier 1-like [Trifolium pratense]|nr:small ubiquitin-related modifier 1-like [Trifolium pratense]XP_045831870.1 small ubiquitin-related modifier 1-like [Trifolium pratense]